MSRQKPEKLVIEPLCAFNKLTGSDGSCIHAIGWNITNQ